MAKAIEQAHIDKPEAHILYRFIGTTPDSSTAHNLLTSLCHELDRCYGSDTDRISKVYHELVADFLTRLRQASAARPLILFLDALDQLSSSQAARSLAWLPYPVPDHVRIIISIRSREIDSSLEQRLAGIVSVGALSPVEGETLLTKWLEAADRTLQTPQRLAVLEKFNQSQGRPLYLRLAFEEARRWRSGSGEPPEELAQGIPGIIRQNLLSRLGQEDKHGEMLVSHVLGYLAASRYGLAEDELVDLLSRDVKVYAWFLRNVFHTPQDILIATVKYLRDRGELPTDGNLMSKREEELTAQRWLEGVRADSRELEAFLSEVLAKPQGPRLPVVLWSRLFFDLQPYLSSTQAGGSPLLAFFHRELGDVAVEQYLADDLQIPFHVKMADYFRDIADPTKEGGWDGDDPRGLSELPYHLTMGAREDQVHDTLTDLKFLDAKINSLGPQALIDDYVMVERTGLSDAALHMIQEGLRLSAHVLSEDPSQCTSQLSGRLLHSDLQPVRRLLDQAKSWDRPWLRPLRPVLIQPGGPLLRTLVGHRGPIVKVAFGPDGQRIISKSGDGTVRVWDPETGDAVRVITDARLAESKWLETERDGVLEQDPNQRFSIRCDHNIIHVDDKNKGGQKRLIGHNHAVTSHAFSPDGTRLVTGGEDHTVRVWELCGDQVELTLEHPGGVTAVAAAQDGSRAVSGGLDGTLRVWNLAEGVEKSALVGHRGRINALAITADDQRAVSASSDGTLKVWDLERGVELLTLRGHESSVRALAMTADGRHAISAGEDQTLRAWDLESGRERAKVEGPQLWEPAIAISPDGRQAAAAYRDRTVRIWDLEHSALTATCIGHMNTIQAVAFSPTARRVASGGDDQTLRVWETETGFEEATLLGHWDAVRALDYSGYGRILSLARDDTVRLWDTHSGRELFRLGGRQVDPSRRSQSPSADRTGAAPTEPLGISADHDGKRAVSFYINDDTLRLWDLENGIQIAAFTGDFVLACCAMASRNSIIAGTRNGGVYLLRLDGADPVPIASKKEEKVHTKAPAPLADWRIEDAGSERETLVEAGVLSASSLQSCSVYRLVHPPAVQLASTDIVGLKGSLTCPCGQETVLRANIAFGGFFSALSKVPLFCPRCSRDMLLIGETGRGGDSYWLLLRTTTGPPGMVEMPGSASGLPELRVEVVEPPATEIAGSG